MSLLRRAIQDRGVVARAARFLMVGGTSAALYSIAAAALVAWNVLGPEAASVVCYALAIPLAFLAQRRFAFQSKGAPGREFLFYAALQLAVLAASSRFIGPFIGADPIVNAIVFLVFGLSAAAISFVICNVLIFRPGRGA